MSEDIVYSLTFSDKTLIDTKGVYDEVNRIMLADGPVETWMIKTDAVMFTDVGMANMVLHFYSDKNVFIMEYATDMRDVFFANDIQYLSMWLQENGWNVPRPHADLIRARQVVWKHYWETMLVDSEYLERKFGPRVTDYSEVDEDSEED